MTPTRSGLAARSVFMTVELIKHAMGQGPGARLDLEDHVAQMLIKRGAAKALLNKKVSKARNKGVKNGNRPS